MRHAAAAVSRCRSTTSRTRVVRASGAGRVRSVRCATLMAPMQRARAPESPAIEASRLVSSTAVVLHIMVCIDYYDSSTTHTTRRRPYAYPCDPPREMGGDQGGCALRCNLRGLTRVLSVLLLSALSRFEGRPDAVHASCSLQPRYAQSRRSRTCRKRDMRRQLPSFHHATPLSCPSGHHA